MKKKKNIKDVIFTAAALLLTGIALAMLAYALLPFWAKDYVYIDLEAKIICTAVAVVAVMLVIISVLIIKGGRKLFFR